MNRTIKDGTVKVLRYETLESLKAHVLAFVTAYNFAKHLQGAALANTVPVHLRGLGEGPSARQDQPAPRHSGPEIKLQCSATCSEGLVGRRVSSLVALGARMRGVVRALPCKTPAIAGPPHLGTTHHDSPGPHTLRTITAIGPTK